MNAVPKLSDRDQQVLRALRDSLGYRENRCPHCFTFHRKDCMFYERLASAIDQLAPGWRELVDK